MEARAVAKYIKGSPQKARLVIDLIRGKSVNEALSILRFSRKRAARPIKSALDSAIANAIQTAERTNVLVDVDDLRVKACSADQGPTKSRRRVRPAPMGRAYREQRRYCHITMVVGTEKEEAEAKA